METLEAYDGAQSWPIEASPAGISRIRAKMMVGAVELAAPGRRRHRGRRTGNCQRGR